MTTALEGGEGSASHPGRSLPPGKIRYPLYRRLGGPPEPVWTGAENFAPTRILFPDLPVRSQSLYWLSYPAHVALCNFQYCSFFFFSVELLPVYTHIILLCYPLPFLLPLLYDHSHYGRQHPCRYSIVPMYVIWWPDSLIPTVIPALSNHVNCHLNTLFNFHIVMSYYRKILTLLGWTVHKAKTDTIREWKHRNSRGCYLKFLRNYQSTIWFPGTDVSFASSLLL